MDNWAYDILDCSGNEDGSFHVEAEFADGDIVCVQVWPDLADEASFHHCVEAELRRLYYSAEPEGL